jgi:Plasmid encoded RepA protein
MKKPSSSDLTQIGELVPRQLIEQLGPLPKPSPARSQAVAQGASISEQRSSDPAQIGELGSPQQAEQPVPSQKLSPAAGRTPTQGVFPGVILESAPKVPIHAPTRAENRLLDALDDIYGGDPRELRYLHVVLAQCGLPYREPETRLPFYEKKNGRSSLVLTPGVLLDPKTRKATLQGIPYGAKPRLLMIHLCTEAKLHKSPEVEIADSMSAFMRDLGLAVTGGKNGSISHFKEQMNRLAATRMQLLFADEDRVSMVNAASPISRYDVWFPRSPNQRMLWPTTVTLSSEFYESLMGQNALPLDARAIRALQQSAMALDIYTWLTHRLCRIPRHKTVPISWGALQAQFGPEYSDIYKFRQNFKNSLAKVLAVYREAKVDTNQNGTLQLRYSPSPVPSRGQQLHR